MDEEFGIASLVDQEFKSDQKKVKFWIKSLAPGENGRNFRCYFQCLLAIGSWRISCEISLRWMSLNLSDDKSPLVQVMYWRLMLPNHSLNQCWPIWYYWAKLNYCQVSNIRRTRSQHLKDSRTVLRLSLPNPLKPDIKSIPQIKLEQRLLALLQLHLSDRQFYCLLRCALYWNHQQCCWFLYVETCNFGETNPQYRVQEIACQVTHVLMT